MAAPRGNRPGVPARPSDYPGEATLHWDNRHWENQVPAVRSLCAQDSARGAHHRNGACWAGRQMGTRRRLWRSGAVGQVCGLGAQAFAIAGIISKSPDGPFDRNAPARPASSALAGTMSGRQRPRFDDRRIAVKAGKPVEIAEVFPRFGSLHGDSADRAVADGRRGAGYHDENSANFPLG